MPRTRHSVVDFAPETQDIGATPPCPRRGQPETAHALRERVELPRGSGILHAGRGIGVEEIVIDGCNLAYKALGGAGDREREALTRALSARYCAKRILVTLVWDSGAGGGLEQVLPNLKVRFATDADAHIRRIVEESPRRASITVVTDDRSVGGSVRSMGAKLVRSSDFVRHWKGMRPPGAPPPPPASDAKPSYETEAEKRRLLGEWEK